MSDGGVPNPEAACMYLLSSRGDVYVGITSTARSSRQAASGGAACKYREHLVEIRSARRQTLEGSSGKSPASGAAGQATSAWWW